MKRLILSTSMALCGFASFAQAAPDPALAERGEYVAKAADCVACHTGPSGVPYAGGRAVPSPFGDIFSSNVTPSDQGIGGYTLDEFSRAVREGIRQDGAQLYPAMPYPTYSLISDEDIAALYSYFMLRVPASDNDPPKTNLTWPFSIRWGVKLWNWAFVPDRVGWPATADAGDPIARGKYLVESLGHCGSCHTPRGLAFQLKAYGGSEPEFLAGSEIDNWPTPSLRAGGSGPGLASWSQEEIAEFLATGRNVHGAVVGEMELVIAHSTSHLTDEDNLAIAAYLKSLPPTRPQPATPPPDTAQQRLTSAKVDINSGERLFLDNCNACHFVDGRGAPPAFPPLKGNTLVNAENPYGVIHVILAGARLPSVPKAPADTAMPNFDWRLSDDEVAAIATFIRSSWGNQAPAVKAADVANVRKRVAEERREPSSGPVFTDP